MRDDNRRARKSSFAEYAVFGSKRAIEKQKTKQRVIIMTVDSFDFEEFLHFPEGLKLRR